MRQGKASAYMSFVNTGLLKSAVAQLVTVISHIESGCRPSSWTPIKRTRMSWIVFAALAIQFLPISVSGQARPLTMLAQKRPYSSGVFGIATIQYQGDARSLCFYTRYLREMVEVGRYVCERLGYKYDFAMIKYEIANTNATKLMYGINCSNVGKQPKRTCLMYLLGCGRNNTNEIEVYCKDDLDLKGLFNVTLLGSQPHSGVLEVTSSEGKKAAVCSDSPDNSTIVSKIACRQMGYSDVQKVGYSREGVYGGNTFTSVYCNGTQPTLASCSMVNKTSCPRLRIIEVSCKLDITSQRYFDIRLKTLGGPGYYGTVEVYRYGRWGVICDTGWNMNAANVVCRELGFRSAKSAPKDANYGAGTNGLVFWNNVRCTGNEPSISKCKYDVAYGRGVCLTVNASGVMCSKERLPSFELCNDTVTSFTIPSGVSYLRSPGYPNLFSFKANTKCACSTTMTQPSAIAGFISIKMFNATHSGFGSSDVMFQVSGTAFVARFESGKSDGFGNFSIQLKALQAATFTCWKSVYKVTTTTTTTTTAITSDTTVTTGVKTTTDGLGGDWRPKAPSDPGVVGICIGVLVGWLLIALSSVVLWKKGFIHFGLEKEKDNQRCEVELTRDGEGEIPAPVIYENLRPGVQGPSFDNIAFVSDGAYATANQDQNSGYSVAELREPVYDIFRPSHPPGGVANEAEFAGRGNNESTLEESLYAKLGQADRHEYMDFRSLSAEALKPTLD